MTEIYTINFVPESGKVVNLPSDVKRINTERTGSPKIGYGTFHVGVAGTGEVSKHVIIAADTGTIDLESSSQFLAVDTASNKAFYAVPQSEY